MHIEDKIQLNDISDAVSVSINKLKLVPAVVFQSEAINLIENLFSFKNVINKKITQ